MEGDSGQTVLSNLRACLISAQGGVPLRSLNKDYRELLGEDIPFKQFGYSSLEAYLKSIPEINLFSKGSELFVEARKTSASAHIVDLVEYQKKAPGAKRKKGLPAVSRRGRYIPPNKPPRAQNTRQYPTQSKKFEPPAASRTMVKIPMQPPKPMPVVVYNPDPPPRQAPPTRPPVNETNKLNQPRVGGFQPLPDLGSLRRPNNYQSPVSTFSDYGTVASSGRGVSTKVKPPTPPISSIYSMNERLEKLRTSDPSPEPHFEPPKPKPLMSIDTSRLVQRESFNGVSNSATAKMEQLQELCTKHGWMSPTYSLVAQTSKGRSGQPVYHCHVMVPIPENCPPYTGEAIHAYTYPIEYNDQGLAKEAGAAKALELAEKMVKEVAKHLPITKDYELIEDRIVKLTKDHRMGLWADHIRRKYQEKYNESLPQNWIAFLSECKNFGVDRFGAENGIIIRYKQEKGQIPDVELANAEYLDIYVTHIAKGNEIWFRQIGEENSAKYYDLMIAMEEYYSSPSRRETPQFIMVNQYYVYFNLEEKYCLRVLVTSKGTNTVRVFLIDHGDSEDVNVNHLYTLHQKFTQLPAQGVRAFLEDLEPLREDVFALDYLQLAAEGKELVAQVTSTQPLRLRLYDTSVDPQVLINDKIFEDLRDTKRAPSLEFGRLVEGKVTGLLTWEPVCIQIRSKTMMMLEDALKAENIEKFVKPASANNKKTVLLKRGGEYHRANILHFHTSYVRVELVDFGKEETCTPSDLFEVNDSSGVLDVIAPQVVKVSLKDIPLKTFGGEVMDRFQEIIAEDNSVVVKLMEQSTSDFPIVEMFKRTQPGNLLASINTNLAHILQTSNGTSEAAQLERVTIPFDEFFDVYVVECIDPYKISVIPGNYIPQLRKLCQDLNSFFRNHNAMPLSDPKPGMLCAVEHKKSWNRGIVHKIISKEQICVKFVDFCNIDVYNRSEVKVLSSAFRNIPALGYTFKLMRIQPVNNVWEIADGFRLSELTEGKRLVSIVRKSAPHPYNEGDVIYEADLYDTTGDDDIDISELFVREGRAKYSTHK